MLKMETSDPIDPRQGWPVSPVRTRGQRFAGLVLLATGSGAGVAGGALWVIAMVSGLMLGVGESYAPLVSLSFAVVGSVLLTAMGTFAYELGREFRCDLVTPGDRFLRQGMGHLGESIPWMVGTPLGVAAVLLIATGRLAMGFVVLGVAVSMSLGLRRGVERLLKRW